MGYAGAFAAGLVIGPVVWHLLWRWFIGNGQGIGLLQDGGSANCITYTGNPSGALTMTSPAGFSGTFNYGNPPGGDFAPSRLIGLNYEASGYY